MKFCIQAWSSDYGRRLRGCGFESRRRILDGHDIFHNDLLLELKRPKINEKEAAGVGPFKKSFVYNFNQPFTAYLINFDLQKDLLCC